jgi:hypothetical protein
MTRVLFESVPTVSPDDDTSDRARRDLLPLGKVIAGALVISGAAIGLGWMQRQAVEPEIALTWSEVKSEARRSQRNVAVFFVQSDCVPCVRMQAETLADPTIQSMMARGWVFHQVDLDAAGAATLAAELGVTEPPAFVLTAAGGTVLLDAAGAPIRATGYLDAAQLRDLLTRDLAGEETWRRRHQSGKLTDRPDSA